MHRLSCCRANLQGAVEQRTEESVQGTGDYVALDGERVVLLLIGGDKSTQGRDIETAKAYWQDYRERTR